MKMHIILQCVWKGDKRKRYTVVLVLCNSNKCGIARIVDLEVVMVRSSMSLWFFPSKDIPRWPYSPMYKNAFYAIGRDKSLLATAHFSLPKGFNVKALYYMYMHVTSKSQETGQ